MCHAGVKAGVWRTCAEGTARRMGRAAAIRAARRELMQARACSVGARGHGVHAASLQAAQSACQCSGEGARNTTGPWQKEECLEV